MFKKNHVGGVWLSQNRPFHRVFLRIPIRFTAKHKKKHSEGSQSIQRLNMAFFMWWWGRLNIMMHAICDYILLNSAQALAKPGQAEAEMALYSL